MEAGQYTEALSAFEALEGLKIALIKLSSVILLSGVKRYGIKDVNVGDTYTFGSYEQDNNNSNGKEAIKWKVNIGEELDFMFLDIDDEDDNPFSEEIELDDKALDEDDLLGKNTEETIKDEYEFNDVDPEVFRDPTRMVKWLKKNE